GDAVGRHEGRAIFVAGGLPGELVRARFTRERGSYARAALVEVLRASPDRVAPRYPELADSGGFQWQHLAYPAQVAWKSRIVRQLLMRVGHFANPPVAPTLGMPAGADPWRYRTVAQFAIGPAGEIGFRRMESHTVIDMPTCPIVHPTLDALYQRVRGWLRSTWGEAAADYVERFTLRVAIAAPGASGTTDVMGNPGNQRAWDAYSDAEVGLLTLEARPGGALDAFGGPEAVGAAICEAAPALAGVVILGMAGGRGRVVVGQDFVHEHVLDRRFRISAGSFFQVNPTQTPTLVRTALAALRPQPGDWALDGYSGVGLFSLFLADHVAHVRAIESQPSAVANARASATLNGVSNVSITEGVLERTLGELRRQRERADIALVDPPRSGCHPRALTEIAALRPRALVYVSCDPSTLARDLRLICDAGYHLTSVQPVDMFPFTAHIECVALCERVDG
ncbi:MAG: 23S rRNA (uracil(1939)-C(5))-methyltransferase RlmD, partial [Ktedonobacterales bacterium]